MLLYCVRHGETMANAAGQIQGQTDSPLSEAGWKQCHAVSAALATQPIEAIFASPLRRALDTAQHIAAALKLEVQIEPRLMEINAGVFQGLGWSEIERRYPADAAAWKSQDPDFRIPNGESRRDLMLRAAEAFTAARGCGHKQVLIVAHGGSLAAALKALLGVPAERNPFALYNAAITRLAWEREVKLLSFNQVDHLNGLVGHSGDL
jgi:broad specificity phosphatase PhoE